MKIWLKTMSAFLAVAILLSLTSVLSPTAVNATEINSLEESLVNSESCVEFIEENFERVISEYNAAHTDAAECKATSIEGRTLVYLTNVQTERHALQLSTEGIRCQCSISDYLFGI